MNHHIIYKQKATIQVAKEAEAYAVQNAISEVMKNELPQLLQPVFDEMAGENEIIRIDSLQLDLGPLPSHDIKQAFVKQLIEEIKKAIVVKKEKETAENGVAIIRKEQSLREAFLHFLQWGTKSWFVATKSREDWESEMQRGFAKQDWKMIVAWLQEKNDQQPIVVKRLVHQFSDDFLETIITYTMPFGKEEWKAVYRDLITLFVWLEEDNKPAIRNEVLNYCLTSFLHQQPLLDALYDVIKAKFTASVHNEHFVVRQQSTTTENIITTDVVRRITERLAEEISSKANTRLNEDVIKNESDGKIELLESNRARDVVNREGETGAHPADEQVNVINNEPGKKNQPSVNIIEQEPQYVSNSGIVLLHPFLEIYFAEFGLLRERKFINEDACKHAVLLLHYLATGETEGEEWNLLLQKLICGLSLEETLPNRIELTEKEREESATLLQSVINYCPPLKNTSLAGLRSTFLQRDGRLEKKENGWLLTVEQKTVDILLDKLPWGFSTIRLPWLTEIISVDWC